MNELKANTRLNVKTEKEIDVWIYLSQDIESTFRRYPDTALTVEDHIKILEIALGRAIKHDMQTNPFLMYLAGNY